MTAGVVRTIGFADRVGRRHRACDGRVFESGGRDGPIRALQPPDGRHGSREHRRQRCARDRISRRRGSPAGKAERDRGGSGDEGSLPEKADERPARHVCEFGHRVPPRR